LEEWPTLSATSTHFEGLHVFFVDGSERGHSEGNRLKESLPVLQNALVDLCSGKNEHGKQINDIIKSYHCRCEGQKRKWDWVKTVPIKRPQSAQTLTDIVAEHRQNNVKNSTILIDLRLALRILNKMLVILLKHGLWTNLKNIALVLK
jgi:hypothetical protein